MRSGPFYPHVTSWEQNLRPKRPLKMIPSARLMPVWFSLSSKLDLNVLEVIVSESRRRGLILLSSSQDVEDPDLRVGPARRGRVHAQHLPEGAAAQPRAARVRPVQPPPHPQQGATPPSRSRSDSTPSD